MIEIYLATEEDINFFFEIKSNKDNMYWSGHSIKPTYARIEKFLIDQIKSQNTQLTRKIYIIIDTLSKEKLGYLYLDPINCYSALVSIAVMDKYSGNGIGRTAMKRLIETACDFGYQTLFADIREDNERSQRLFKAIGFNKTEKYRFMYIENISKEIKMLEFMRKIG